MPDTITPSNIRNKSLERAKFAFEQVKNVTSGANALDAGNQKKFKSHVKDVPMMIKTNGLAAAYAFVYSKAKDKGYEAIETISDQWLVSRQHIITKNANQQFYDALVHVTDPNVYRRATREILSLFTWLKRYADGMIND